MRRQAEARARRRNRIITTAVVGILGVILAVGIVWFVRSQTTATPAAAPSPVANASLLVRNDSRMLNEVPDSKVTFVEFLDFECEACGAAYPSVEQLRDKYGDRVTFVVRYFPLPSHRNAMPAARAVEAAAQQGKFEAMYRKMFDTQDQWGEQQASQDALFRTYAQQLNLDLNKWDAAFSSPKTVARINADVEDGTQVGVNSTPSFFINGVRVQPRAADDLANAIEQALQSQ